MRIRPTQRLICLFGVSALVCAPVAAGAQGSSTSTTAPSTTAGSSSVSVLSCTQSSTQADRSAGFSAQMSAIAGTKTLQELFQLQESTPAAPVFANVTLPAGAAPTFGVWQNSSPGITVLNDTQTVTDLPAPASFRVEVSFRWLGAHKKVLKLVHRVTASCKLSLANLVVGAVQRQPGATPDATQYTVSVRNDGDGPAGSFQVGLSVGAAAASPLTVLGLAPHTQTQVVFTAPKCTAGTTLTVVADPQQVIQETDRSAATKGIPC
jgi:hypothetical protein